MSPRMPAVRLRILPSLLPRDIEIRVARGIIEQRYVGETDWRAVAAVTDLTGPRGPAVEMRLSGDSVQYRASGSTEPWRPLFPISLITPAIPDFYGGDTITLPVGEPASVLVDRDEDGSYTFQFSIPEGQRGLPGTTDYEQLENKPTLGSLSAQNTINNADWSGADLSVDNGGTGASTPAAARTNLGLGSAATSNANDFATAAQGGRADTAVQPVRMITAGTGMAGGGDLSANRTLSLSAATQTSLGLANTSVQPARAVNAGTGLTGGGNLSVDRTIALNAATTTSLGRADTAVQPARSINPGTGLAGGGDLSADRTMSLSSASQASLGLADSAVQPSRAVNTGTGLTGGGNLSANRTISLSQGIVDRLVPTDGTTGQTLIKTDAGFAWATPAGGGDMLASVYDPQGIQDDPFARQNQTGTQAISTVSGLQAALDGKQPSGNYQPTGDYATNTALSNGLATRIPASEKAQPNGTATLGEDGILSEAQRPPVPALPANIWTGDNLPSPAQFYAGSDWGSNLDFPLGTVLPIMTGSLVSNANSFSPGSTATPGRSGGGFFNSGGSQLSGSWIYVGQVRTNINNTWYYMPFAMRIA